MRATWVESRKGQANVSQMHYARQGVITEEMAHVAKRENLPESLIMEEVARGRMIIPANFHILSSLATSFKSIKSSKLIQLKDSSLEISLSQKSLL